MIHHRHANRKPPLPLALIPLTTCLCANRLNCAVNRRCRQSLAKGAFGCPMIPRSDRLHTRTWMRPSPGCGKAKRVKRVPEPPVDKLQKGKLRGSQDPSAAPRFDQDAHQPRRRETVPRHCLENGPSHFGVRKPLVHPRDKGTREGERSIRPGGTLL